MTTGKIEVNVGGLTFSAEGEQDWLAKQLDKILEAAPAVAGASHPAPQQTAKQPSQLTGQTGGAFSATLASYIKAQNADDNQVKRFLATADWLQRRGEKTLTTRSVTAALKNNQQKKLTNAADCLNQNVGKGYCEKADGGFFITPDGLKALGHG
jgi:hypothetical protein